MESKDQMRNGTGPERGLNRLRTGFRNLIKQEHPAKYQLQLHATHCFCSGSRFVPPDPQTGCLLPWQTDQALNTRGRNENRAGLRSRSGTHLHPTDDLV
jgi:hypothetical protein